MLGAGPPGNSEWSLDLEAQLAPGMHGGRMLGRGATTSGRGMHADALFPLSPHTPTQLMHVV